MKRGRATLLLGAFSLLFLLSILHAESHPPQSPALINEDIMETSGLMGVEHFLEEDEGDDGVVEVKLAQGAVRGSTRNVALKRSRGGRSVVTATFHEFLGIPFAESPAGLNRWQPPIKHQGWRPEILEATQYGDCCPQTPGLIDGLTMGEDCLSINVFTPVGATESNDLLPVLVFIYGGGFTQGCSAQPAYYGAFVANSTSTVFVTFNYRLGALGFLHTTQFQGNFGLMDQLLALQWVQDNIRTFGGDPTRVTISGQSAGAMSVGIHLSSPVHRARPPFQAVIMESNPIAIQFRTPGEMIPYGESFAYHLQCSVDDIACFQNRSIADILAAQDATFELPIPEKLALSTALPWEPMVDGRILTGQILDVPVIMGTVQNETASFAFGAAGFLNGKIFGWEYSLLVDVFFGSLTSEILRRYPPSTGDNSLGSLIRLSSDFLFECSTRNASLALSRSVPTYAYHFLHSPSRDPFNDNSDCRGSVVCHGAELAFVFHTMDFYPGFQFTADEDRLSWDMLRDWTTFAAGMTSSGNWTWPKLNRGTLLSLDLDVPDPQVVTGYNADNCAFWDSVGYDF